MYREVTFEILNVTELARLAAGIAIDGIPVIWRVVAVFGGYHRYPAAC
jgi:hypothetical protein